PSAALKIEYGPGRVFSENVAPDVNKDGKLDGVFLQRAGGRNDVSVALGDGAGHFTTQVYVASEGPADVVTFHADVSHSMAAVVDDFDGDGVNDVVVASDDVNGGNRPGDISVLLGKGDGTLKAPRLFRYTSTQQDTLRSTVLADFNGTGKLDLALL